MTARSLTHGPIALGLGVNLEQFSLLVLINAFVGGMVGLERTVLPLIAEREFGLASKSAILSFIVSFGIVKALANLLAGKYSDVVGRKNLLVLGWIFGLPVPFMVGSLVENDYGRELAARDKPRVVLVNHRDNEDRPRRSKAERLRDGPE